MIEGSSLHLKRPRVARESAIAKAQLQSFAAVSQVKLAPQLDRKTCAFELRQHSQFLKEAATIWQQRLANMKTWKMLLFEHQHAFAGAGQQRGNSTSPRSASNHQGVVITNLHHSTK